VGMCPICETLMHRFVSQVGSAAVSSTSKSRGGKTA
jgi:hypothetical protein